MSVYNFKKIQVIPTSNDFIDIVLSKTQRKTPTVVHKHYQISRIRSFYMKKVKFAQDAFDEKLVQILEDFPKLEEIHPFFSDLINVLYDRDHYKLALGQLNTAKHLISNVGRDYSRLLKFGDSLFRCKQLKKAALGRMATIMKRQKDTLAYLEQVRQHLSRLPSIDPNTRTLLVCGYPNVGKSSFMNKLTRAEVDVQPYAFTTKSLFVGHMDYKYLRWQVIDTPGILDHPLDERNTIEMLSITALAHLRACIMYFIDLSEQCGYTIAEQVKLFHSIKPLFNNKPIILVISKIDARTLGDLSVDELALVESITKEGVEKVELSCHNEVGIMEARNFACETLLAARVDSKVKGGKALGILNKIHVAIPQERDDKERPAFIPEAALKKRAKEEMVLERDIEAENGGAGVYSVDLKKKYLLKNEEWKYDIIPEIMDGHNVADFIDPEIEAKLDLLEKEEEALEKEFSFEMPELNEEDKRLKTLASEIREKKNLMIHDSRMKKGKNRPVLVAKGKARSESTKGLTEKMSELGVELEGHVAVPTIKKRKRDEDEAEVLAAEADDNDEIVDHVAIGGLRNVKQKLITEKIAKKFQRKRNLAAKKGEGDRVVLQSRPKHLFAGKRGMGGTDRR